MTRLWRWLRRSKPSAGRTDETTRRLTEANTKLAQAESRDEEINNVTDRLRVLRKHNRFAELIEDALRRQSP